MNKNGKKNFGLCAIVMAKNRLPAAFFAFRPAANGAFGRRLALSNLRR
jgi:hypothetical protein